MRNCICGKPLPRRKEKGHREREYCSDRCRQRACRERNQGKHDIDRIIRESSERSWNAIEQNVRRETWQDDIARLGSQLQGMEDLYLYQRDRILVLEEYIESLESQMADKEAEIARLTTLLDSQSKRKRP